MHSPGDTANGDNSRKLQSTTHTPILVYIESELRSIGNVFKDKASHIKGLLNNIIKRKTEVFALCHIVEDKDTFFEFFLLKIPGAISENCRVDATFFSYKEQYSIEVGLHLLWMSSIRYIDRCGQSCLAKHIISRSELIKEHPGLLLDILKGIMDTIIAGKDKVLCSSHTPGELRFFTDSVPMVLLELSKATDMFSSYPERYKNEVLIHI